MGNPRISPKTPVTVILPQTLQMMSRLVAAGKPQAKDDNEPEAEEEILARTKKNELHEEEGTEDYWVVNDDR